MQTPIIVFRLLVAAAWIDGEIHPAEGLLLAQFLQRLGLAESELEQQKVYLSQRPATDTSALWVAQFQKAHPDRHQRDAALKAVQSILAADGQLLTEEEHLLTQLKTALAEEDHSLLQQLKQWLTNLVGRKPIQN
jgi:uncharacterized tellurite resistance protein B-like protein